MAWRRMPWWSYLAAALALTALVWHTYRLLTPDLPPIWRAYDQVRQGMSEEEVGALLGEPAYCEEGGLFGCCGLRPLSWFGAARQKVWACDEVVVKVGFDRASRVRCKDSNARETRPLGRAAEARLLLQRAVHLARDKWRSRGW